MAPSNAKKTDKRSKDKSEATAKKERQVLLRPMRIKHGSIRIVSTTSYMQHKWSDKALKEIRAKQQDGKKTRERELRNPEEECEAATYRLSDGSNAVPFSQIKNAMTAAADKDLGIPKTLFRKGFFIIPDEGYLLRLESQGGSKMREDFVRVGRGSTDLRYRPTWERWSVEFQFEYDSELLQMADILALLERAGFGVGIGEWRPERNGIFGRFAIDRSSVKEWQ